MGARFGGLQDHAGTLDSVAAVRRFNRLYYRKMFAVRETFQAPAIAGMRVRVLRELEQCPMGCTSAWLVYKLGIDPGQLSRILADYIGRGYVIETRRSHDRRLKGVALASKASVLRNALDRTDDAVIARMFGRFAPGDHARFQAALATVERLLDLDRPTAPAK